MSKISFVYFDVGGVAIQDFSGTNKWTQMMRDLGLPVGQDASFEAFYKELEKEVCVGRDLATIVPELQEKFALTLPPNFSLLAYFIDHFEKNEAIWPVIQAAKNKYRLGLLTDMYPGMLAGIEQAGLLPPITWDVIIDSSVEGVKKPSREIFLLAEQKSGAPHEEILFVENSQKNYQAALDFGWQGFLYDSSNPTKSAEELAQFLGLSAT